MTARCANAHGRPSLAPPGRTTCVGVSPDSSRPHPRMLRRLERRGWTGRIPTAFSASPDTRLRLAHRRVSPRRRGSPAPRPAARRQRARRRPGRAPVSPQGRQDPDRPLACESLTAADHTDPTRHPSAPPREQRPAQRMDVPGLARSRRACPSMGPMPAHPDRCSRDADLPSRVSDQEPTPLEKRSGFEKSPPARRF
jgi:hypothetical protein